MRDLSDVADIRYGTGFGLGISAQFAELFQSGLGCSVEWYQRQWFGRKSVEVRNGLFAHALIIGFDGDYLRRLGPDEWFSEGSASTGSFDVLIFKMNTSNNEAQTGNESWFTESGGDPPRLESGRFGGALFLPGVNGGLYLNLGELVDFFCGIVGYDLMNDNGYPKFFTPESHESS